MFGIKIHCQQRQSIVYNPTMGMGTALQKGDRTMKPGRRNLITDVAGILVGNADDATLKSGATVLLGKTPFTAGVHIMGGAPGTRETDLLTPDRLVQKVDAITLSGGSAFGLDAASGVAAGLRKAGRGFQVGTQNIPIVPGAILFDLLNGGNKDWDQNPYADLGATALQAAAEDFQLGTVGAGFGALTHGLKGGLGSTSVVMASGVAIGALVAVNSVGSVLAGQGPEFRAAFSEMNGEFGGLGPARALDSTTEPLPHKGQGEATTIAIIATDADLTQAEATRLAIAAHDGMARAIWPSHSLFDGDLVFAAATGAVPLQDHLTDLFQLGHAAALCLERAIARGVYAATPSDGDTLPTWQTRFGG